jgi:RNA polymerase sigma-70 factor (ECF subfamily)
MAAYSERDSWLQDASFADIPHPEAAVMSTSGSESDAAPRFEAEAMPHLNDIFRTASRIIGDRGAAEDVTQDVFLRAWKSFDRFTPGTNCRAWLFKILFHCVSHHRRRWFRIRLLKESEEFLEASLTYEPPVATGLTDQDILAALDRIPPDFRAVVLLVDVEEFAYKEAADILSVPIGTVMSRLSRGRKLLRDLLGDVARAYGIAKTVPEEG